MIRSSSGSTYLIIGEIYTPKQLGRHHLGNRQSRPPLNVLLEARARQRFQRPTGAMYGRNSHWQRSSQMGGKPLDIHGPGVLLKWQEVSR